MSQKYNHSKEQFTWRKNNAGTFLTSLGSFFWFRLLQAEPVSYFTLEIKFRQPDRKHELNTVQAFRQVF
jgi:hypothetical protein